MNAAAAKNAKNLVTIKKYANRRLYNTETSTYITLEDVAKMVKDSTEFEVRDAKTGEDLTRQILTQIIVEQELRGQSVLSVGFLKRVIHLYDDSIREVLPHYLEQSMEGFMQNQEKIRQYVDETWGQYNPLGQFSEIGRQNMEIFSKTMQMFNPFDAFFNAVAPGASPEKTEDDSKNRRGSS